MCRNCPTPTNFDVAAQARDVAARQPGLRGISNNLEFTAVKGVLVIRGKVPTFYLKQLLQTELLQVEGVRRIDNQAEVTYPRSRSNPPELRS